MPKKHKKQTIFNFFSYDNDPFKPEYNQIYFPLLLGLGVMGIGFLVASLTRNVVLGQILFGLSSIIMATSGYWQIKLKIVPGMPVLHGSCAVVFGIVFLIFFTLLGLGVIFFK